jgi:hypothetical protein
MSTANVLVLPFSAPEVSCDIARPVAGLFVVAALGRSQSIGGLVFLVLAPRDDPNRIVGQWPLQMANR